MCYYAICDYKPYEDYDKETYIIYIFLRIAFLHAQEN